MLQKQALASFTGALAAVVSTEMFIVLPLGTYTFEITPQIFPSNNFERNISPNGAIKISA